MLTHRTVLLEEAVSAVLTRRDGRYVDATYGRGGHTLRMLGGLNEHGQVFAFDKDPDALQHAIGLFDPRFCFIHASFRNIARELAERGVRVVTGVLFDLGVSSPQLDDPARGFSFRFDAPLDMRMDNSRGETAAEWLARATEREIGEVLWTYGQERFAKSIAKAIVAGRQAGRPVRTTGELQALVAREVKTREPGQDPATRSFQAIRIHVNAELEELQAALIEAIGLLEPGGRIAVISFHSLEDRLVKRIFQAEAGKLPPSADPRARDLPPADAKPPRLRLLGKQVPSAEEVAANPRARSAIMRVAERTASRVLR
jgi:16S rRNA (cytosine1402-N4)-methyltransferase